jgi:protein AATF/BFR2
LTKWSEKVKAASGLPVNKKFKALNQSITYQLQENLTDRERLIDRTRTKRATFSVLGSNDLEDDRKETIDPEIFDDMDFYHPLLKDLVERKALDVPMETWTRPTKVKKNKKDTRASKGRKLRYHEHEKIQNFMAPMADGTWHEEQIEQASLTKFTYYSELFASLLGRRIQVGEDDEMKGEPVLTLANNDGLKIFG